VGEDTGVLTKGSGATDITWELYKKALSIQDSSHHPAINYPIISIHLQQLHHQTFPTTQPPSCSSPSFLPLFSPSPPLAQLPSVTRPRSLNVLPVFVVASPLRSAAKPMLRASQT
jgi:hypothetical protein